MTSTATHHTLCFVEDEVDTLHEDNVSTHKTHQHKLHKHCTNAGSLDGFTIKLFSHRWVQLKIKADRPTRWTPLDYWQTDNSSGLVMVIGNYHWLNSTNWVLISTCSAPLVQTGERKQFSVFDLDLDIQLQDTQGQGRPSCQKSRSKVKRFKQESAHRQTDGHTHRCYQTYYRPCYAVVKHGT